MKHNWKKILMLGYRVDLGSDLLKPDKDKTCFTAITMQMT